MLVEPGDILSAIFLTHAEEKEAFILVAVALLSFLACVAWTMSDSLSVLLCPVRSFVPHLALLLFFILLVCCYVKLGCVQTCVSAVSQKRSLLIRFN